mgnify:CR=1 FL=1
MTIIQKKMSNFDLLCIHAFNEGSIRVYRPGQINISVVSDKRHQDLKYEDFSFPYIV